MLLNCAEAWIFDYQHQPTVQIIMVRSSILYYIIQFGIKKIDGYPNDYISDYQDIIDYPLPNNSPRIYKNISASDDTIPLATTHTKPKSLNFWLGVQIIDGKVCTQSPK